MSTVQDEADAGPGNPIYKSDSDESSSQGNTRPDKLLDNTIEPIGIVDILKSVREVEQQRDHAEIQKDLNGADGNSAQQEDEEGSDYFQHEGLGRQTTRRPSSADGSLSTPDDTPSIQVSLLTWITSFNSLNMQNSLLSSPGQKGRLSGRGHSPTPSLRPFDRRFQARLSQSPISSPRAVSPAFLATHSRQSSVLGPIDDDNGDIDTVEAPWEVIRWTRLKKISGQAFSEIGKRSFGRPTCIAVSALIAIGTSKGIILIFDYHQNLKTIIGPGTQGKGLFVRYCVFLAANTYYFKLLKVEASRLLHFLQINLQLLEVMEAVQYLHGMCRRPRSHFCISRLWTAAG